MLTAWEPAWIANLLWCLRAGEARVARVLARRCAYTVLAGTRSLRGDDGIDLVRILGGRLGALLLAELGILVEHALGVEDVWVGGRVGEAISGERVGRGPSVHGSSIFGRQPSKTHHNLIQPWGDSESVTAHGGLGSDVECGGRVGAQRVKVKQGYRRHGLAPMRKSSGIGAALTGRGGEESGEEERSAIRSLLVPADGRRGSLSEKELGKRSEEEVACLTAS